MHEGEYCPRCGGALRAGASSGDVCPSCLLRLALDEPSSSPDTRVRDSIDRYRLDAVVGRGGMGVVWKAHDPILQRTVAIKVLPPEVSGDPRRREMFLAEARMASSVSDSSIVQVFEFGRDGDDDFIVMEYVEGQPLSRILHGGPLPVDRVLHLGTQIASAICRAHRRNLLHRDLKPANVLVTPEDQVKVVDFGLAALFEPPEDSNPEDDDVGMSTGRRRGIVGTPAYASPEQLRAESLDRRSDIFSLGVVLYEMTTGRRPFDGTTPDALLRAILDTRPVPPHLLVAGVPPELERILSKALARQRGNRYQSMDDLLVDLRRLGRDLAAGPSTASGLERRGRRTWITLGAVTAALLLATLWARHAMAPGITDRASVMVPPFSVSSPSGETAAEGVDFVGLALAEALTVHLAQVPSLHVVSSPPADGGGGDPDSIRGARRQGIAHCVVGRILRERDTLRGSVQLIRTEDGRILWGTELAEIDGDLSSVAAQLARQVAAAMGARIPQRYEALEQLHGGPAMRSSRELLDMLAALRDIDIPQMVSASERLVQSFPDEADAWTHRGVSLAWRYYEEPAPPYRQQLEEAVAALERMDPQNPYGEALLAWLAGESGDPRSCLERMTRVIDRDDLAPGTRAWVLVLRSIALKRLRREASALEDLERALSFDPVNPVILYTMSSALRRAHRLDDALERSSQALRLAPSLWIAWQHHGLVLADLGRGAEAAMAFEKACSLSESQSACAVLANCLLELGRTEDAARATAEAERRTPSQWGELSLARYALRLGRRREALDRLGRAVTLGYSDRSILEDATFVELRGDPEFEGILKQIAERTR